MSRISRDQPRGAVIFRGRLEEVAAGAGAEVLRLADVDHPARGVLHQVHAGSVGEGPHLLGRRRVVVRNVGVRECRTESVA